MKAVTSVGDNRETVGAGSSVGSGTPGQGEGDPRTTASSPQVVIKKPGRWSRFLNALGEALGEALFSGRR